MSKAPDPALLRKLLSYDAETGTLHWRERTPDMFEHCKQDSGWACRKWNGQWAGRAAFTAVDRGYLQGQVYGYHANAHRVIWALQTGAWPLGTIDHINGNGADNRWSNLREVSQSTNCCNTRRYSNNTSGEVGVFWDKRRLKWSAHIRHLGKQRFLGYFDVFADAVAARKKAESGLPFTSRHGKPVQAMASAKR